MLVIDACHILSCLHDLPSKFTLACFEAPDIAYGIRGLGFYASWLSRCMLSCTQWVHTSTQEPNLQRLLYVRQPVEHCCADAAH